MSTFIEGVLSVVVALAGYDLLMLVLTWWRNRGKPECEICHKPRVTRKTKDRKYYACKRCRTTYYKENSL